MSGLGGNTSLWKLHGNYAGRFLLCELYLEYTYTTFRELAPILSKWFSYWQAFYWFHQEPQNSLYHGRMLSYGHPPVTWNSISVFGNDSMKAFVRGTVNFKVPDKTNKMPASMKAIYLKVECILNTVYTYCLLFAVFTGKIIHSYYSMRHCI
jgi:hypothetical protein